MVSECTRFFRSIAMLLFAAFFLLSDAYGQVVAPLTAPHTHELEGPPGHISFPNRMAWDLPSVTEVAPATNSEFALPAGGQQLFADDPLIGAAQAERSPELASVDALLAPQPTMVPQVGGEKLSAKPPLWRRIAQDELNFYSPYSLCMIGGGLASGAILANTRFDYEIQRDVQSSLHRANSDEWLEALHANKELGDGRYTLPVFVGAWVIGGLLPESHASEAMHVWGERTLRGFVIGAPPVLLLQLATGGSRPGESSHGSHWEPFQDDNGVSGHSFMGALPFITAAKMTDSKPLKATFYAASALAPLSRTADGAHYPSQIALGWWMAFVAASAVHATDHLGAPMRFYPIADSNGMGMALEYRF